jgi:DNA repair protein RecO (recombination protein O)
MEASRDDPADRDNVLDILSFGFLFKLLEKTGYKAETGQCSVCKGKISDEIYFSPRVGGILCRKCALSEKDKIKISEGAVKIMRIFEKNRLSNFSKIIAGKKDIASLKSAIVFQVKWVI